MSEIRQKVDTILKDFVLTNDVLHEVSSCLLREFNDGLSKEKHEMSCLKMLPTFVRDVPDGTEQGKFLALDLGGTNFRILSIDLNGDQLNMHYHVYDIPQSVMHGTGEHLFDQIAECLENYLDNYELKNTTLPLGFTFSFPCIQNGLTSAVLLHWTKGFDCSGVQGEDIVQMLREAVIRRGGLDIEVVAVVNDSVGTLMSCAHSNRDCRVSVIVGTGINACYMEELENVELWKGDTNDPSQVIINTELGGFGDNGCLEFIRTSFDKDVDDNSINKGKQLFEKMISGMFMGEIARVILVRLIDEKLIFKGELSEEMKTPFEFKTEYISNVEADSKQEYTEARNVMQKMGVIDASDEDCEILKQVCCAVSTRAAYLVSAAIATILNKMKRPQTTVGIDGSLYRNQSLFKELLKKKTEELTSPDYKFELTLSEDGSGRGAALVAAVAVRSKNWWS